ncbi:hypothetical protein [Foetidibacter luteolus]|uniref:hypothetical protein n=1 Tax=Foetidibacter luteolus TaxID=2608880 RepID=UPI00129B7862|nr:hypothetical protein [Foetidibacter luteolus]
MQLFFSEAMIKKVKADVKTFMNDKEKDELYYKFIDWEKQANEMMVLTMHAYADISLPKKFDTAFQINKPHNYVEATITINQAIINGWTSVNQIAHGHKHIIIIDFQSSVPNIFNLLPAFGDNGTTSNETKLGICSNIDFEAIKTNLKRQESQ